jgi:hypothetical protein
MSAFRQPGPTCEATATWRLDDGTLGLLRSPIPGPVGMSIAPGQSPAANSTMKTALQKKKWAVFAKAYNGAGYAKNSYDSKMAEAYARLAPPPPPPTRLAPVPLGHRP